MQFILMYMARRARYVACIYVFHRKSVDSFHLKQDFVLLLFLNKKGSQNGVKTVIIDRSTIIYLICLFNLHQTRQYFFCHFQAIMIYLMKKWYKVSTTVSKVHILAVLHNCCYMVHYFLRKKFVKRFFLLHQKPLHFFLFHSAKEIESFHS